MASYTYDPLKLDEYGVDKMRFELGDTAVEMENLTSPLCDEEYAMVIRSNQDWRSAKIACLKAIVMKLSFEVDTSVTGLSYSLSQRFERWKAMLAEEEKRRSASLSVPLANRSAVSGMPYFYAGMHKNPGRFPEEI